MTVLEVIQRSTEFLARKGVDSPRLHAELLLAEVLKMPRMKLYLNFERTLQEPELAAMREFVRRRGQREPLQHIVGSTSFCGLEITVNGSALVPRPETELLAESGWRFLQQSNSGPPSALDFGTGSGCLAIALAVKCPAATVTALDISPDALALARSNAERNHVAERILFIEGSTLAAVPPPAAFDLIIANPPYVPRQAIGSLQPEVKDYDPHLALDGGEDGLEFYRMLAAEAALRLRPAGKLMVEFGDDQAEALARIFRQQNWIVESIVDDYTQRPRILIASSPMNGGPAAAD